MNEKTLQHQLDRPGGPLFKNNGYFQPLHRREPTARYKSLDRHGRQFQAKRS